MSGQLTLERIMDTIRERVAILEDSKHTLYSPKEAKGYRGALVLLEKIWKEPKLSTLEQPIVFDDHVTGAEGNFLDQLNTIGSYYKRYTGKWCKQRLLARAFAQKVIGACIDDEMKAAEKMKRATRSYAEAVGKTIKDSASQSA